MSKNYSIIIVSILLVAAAWSFFSSNESNSLNIEEGIWIETARSLDEIKATNEKFIIEKVNGKNLLFFSQISANKKNFFFPLVIGDLGNTSHFQPLKLEPFLPCTLTTILKKSKLDAKLDCEGKRKGSLTFEKNSQSLFGETLPESNLSNDEASYLQNIADVEFATREIESLQSSIDELSKMASENNVQLLIEKLESSIKDSIETNKSLSDLDKDVVTKHQQIESKIKNRKNLIRSSSYGTEVELASRINNVEWQISVNRWGDLPNRDDHSNEITDEVLTNNEEELSSEKPQDGNPTKGNSWWKEF